jgi:hypothetical protein
VHHEIKKSNQKIIVMKKRFSILVIVILGTILVSFTGSRLITGKVTDENGQPISGVSVSIKGGAHGTLTDINGSYRISIDENVKTLVFSYIGYSTVEENIIGRSVVNTGEG